MVAMRKPQTTAAIVGISGQAFSTNLIGLKRERCLVSNGLNALQLLLKVLISRQC